MSATIASRPVVVGGKPVANYALAIATRVGQGETTVTLRGRGRFISSVFDACNKALNMGLPLTRGEVRWGQETAPGGEKNVSFVEVILVGKEG